MDESHHSDTVQYREIPGYPGYRVGDDGSVWSIRSRGSRGQWRLRMPQLNGGYRHVGLTAGKKCLTYRVHRLVLLAFVGPCPAGKVGCHNNGNKEDNRLANLRWDTQASNLKDKELHGTAHLGRGENQHLSRLKEKDVPMIREMIARGITQTSIARRFFVSVSAIHQLKIRKTWAHVK
jgi:hypothetical protein